MPEAGEIPSDMTEPHEPEPDALAIAKSSPEIVLRKDKTAWLDLFAEGARVEDPVGAGAHVGAARLSKFWDVFIAPQRSITFHPRMDFVHGDRVLRYVTISTLTPLSATEAFEIPAIVEYRIRDGRVLSLRAFWETMRAVEWHLKKGPRGAWALTSHGARTFFGLGLGSSLGFGMAMRPKVSKARAAELVESLVAGLASPEGWSVFTEGVDLSVMGQKNAASAYEEGLGGLGPWRVEESLRAGDHVATVLQGAEGAAVALMRVASGRLEQLDLLAHPAHLS